MENQTSLGHLDSLQNADASTLGINIRGGQTLWIKYRTRFYKKKKRKKKDKKYM